MHHHEPQRMTARPNQASAVEGLKCADIVDAMGRLHRHRCHILDLASPTPGRILFGPAVTISYFPSCSAALDPERYNLAYLFYEGPVSALIIDVVFGCVGMTTQLAFLDLAAKSCPRHIEATFFALLMSIYNGGTQISQNIGGRLYDSFGYTPLVLVSTAFTALAWVLVPMVRIDHIEAKAKRADMPAT